MKKREEKASRKTRKKLLICLMMCVYKKSPQSETGNKRLREPHKTRSAKRTSAAEQKREQQDKFIRGFN